VRSGALMEIARSENALIAGMWGDDQLQVEE
jgi:hypothetical protein